MSVEEALQELRQVKVVAQIRAQLEKETPETRRMIAEFYKRAAKQKP